MLAGPACAVLFAMILRKEDARILGLYDHLGRDTGDVVYAVLPGFEREHGRLMPAAALGEGPP